MFNFTSCFVNSLRLDSPNPSQSQSGRSLNPVPNTTLSSENVLQRDPPNLNSIIPDPAVISQQIQSSFQSLLQALNNIGNSYGIFSSLRNLTSSIGIGGLRIDDANYILGNVSEALRIANRSALDASNSSGLQGAFRDFKEVVTRLRSSPLLPTQINAERRAYDAHDNNLEGHASTVTTGMQILLQVRNRMGCAGCGTSCLHFKLRLIPAFSRRFPTLEARRRFSISGSSARNSIHEESNYGIYD
ncbi:hypothetical protein Ocin01_19890 [Orchesella cincta]|uniref:Uncharacterized protein n=1 Tax=Orchesella cincta TaxID=48709 RepID=A0A1D2M1I4_ORCCI|nr:hypothetical protein Ocin01_19890 [Orchesella cincta]